MSPCVSTFFPRPFRAPAGSAIADRGIGQRNGVVISALLISESHPPAKVFKSFTRLPVRVFVRHTDLPLGF